MLRLALEIVLSVNKSSDTRTFLSKKKTAHKIGGISLAESDE